MAYEDTGMTRVTVLTGLHREVSPQERLRRAVQQTLQGQFDLHGELGRGEDGSVVYLATEHASRRLVALKLVRADASTGDGEDWWVEIVRKLDASVPALESTCMECGGKQRGWGRFCRHCGADLSGVAQGGGQNTSAEDLLREVRSAARGRYEILGQMDRAEGGGIVYFAKEIKSGQLVALRLTRQAPSAGGTEIFQLGVTQVLQDFKSSLGVNQTPVTGMTRPTLPPAPTASKEGPVYPPTPVPQTVPPIAPPPAATENGRPADGRMRTAVLVGSVVLLAAAVWFALSRRQSTAEAQPTDTPPTLVDSGAIRLATQLPAGAIINIDGTPVSGDRIRLGVGTHTIGITAPGFQELRQEVEIAKDETVLWTPALLPATPTPEPPPRIAPPQVSRPPRPQPAATKTAAEPPPVSTVPEQKEPAPPTVPAPDPRASPTSCGGLASQLEWTRAAPKCEEEARAGAVSAARMLGTMYEQGLGVGRNLGTAARWYQQAVEGGDSFAMYRLGYMIMEGQGIRRDERGGMDLLKRAVDAGQPDAFYHYGRGLERGRGRPRNMNEAIATFRRGAELNNALSQHKMGLLHMDGDGVAKDDRQAAEYFTRSAGLGYSEAQFMIGEFYRLGRGVAQSDAEARKWLQQAAAKGHQQARAALGRLR
jgi:hypothetical protein